MSMFTSSVIGRFTSFQSVAIKKFSCERTVAVKPSTGSGGSQWSCHLSTLPHRLEPSDRSRFIIPMQ